MHIQSIPMCNLGHSPYSCFRNTLTYSRTGTGPSNNYAYIVKDDKTNDAVIIDPANPPEWVGDVDGRVGTSDKCWQSGTSGQGADRCWTDQLDGHNEYTSVSTFGLGAWRPAYTDAKATGTMQEVTRRWCDYSPYSPVSALMLAIALAVQRPPGDWWKGLWSRHTNTEAQWNFQDRFDFGQGLTHTLSYTRQYLLVYGGWSGKSSFHRGYTIHRRFDCCLDAPLSRAHIFGQVVGAFSRAPQRKCTQRWMRPSLLYQMTPKYMWVPLLLP